jgi:hypothetical protein
MPLLRSPATTQSRYSAVPLLLCAVKRQFPYCAVSLLRSPASAQTRYCAVPQLRSFATAQCRLYAVASRRFCEAWTSLSSDHYRRVAFPETYALNVWHVVQGLARRLWAHSHFKSRRAERNNSVCKTNLSYEMEAFTLHAERRRTGPTLTEPWALDVC